MIKAECIGNDVRTWMSGSEIEVLAEITAAIAHVHQRNFKKYGPAVAGAMIRAAVKTGIEEAEEG